MDTEQREHALSRLFDEIRLSFHALVRLGETLHAEESVTLGMRAVMEFLLRNGPHTVPEIARARGVSRQRIQTIANSLDKAGLIEACANPAHKRSAKLILSADGRAAIERMTRREAKLMRAQAWPVGAEAVAGAADILSDIRRKLSQVTGDLSASE